MIPDDDVEYLHFGALDDDYKLFELPPEVLSTIQSDSGITLELLGRDSETYLCTPSSTFKVFQVQCTNSMLLKPSFDEEISQVLHSYYEVVEKPEAVIIHELRTLLRSHIHRGNIDEFGDPDTPIVPVPSASSSSSSSLPFFSKQRIQPTSHLTAETIRLNHVFCSSETIHRCLTSLGALSFLPSDSTADRYFKLLHPSTEAEILDLICLTLIEHRWSLQSIDGEIIRSELSDYDNESVFHGLWTLATDEDRDRRSEIDGCWEFDIKRIGRFKAKKLFSRQSEWSYGAFMSRWTQEMREVIEVSPSGAEEESSSSSVLPSVESLYGVCMIIKPIERERGRRGSGSGTGRDMIVYLEENELPLNERERFQRLFQVKKRWTLEQLRPYVEIYVTRHRSVEKVLGVHCKATKAISAGRYFVAKF